MNTKFNNESNEIRVQQSIITIVIIRNTYSKYTNNKNNLHYQQISYYRIFFC